MAISWNDVFLTRRSLRTRRNSYLLLRTLDPLLQEGHQRVQEPLLPKCRRSRKGQQVREEKKAIVRGYVFAMLSPPLTLIPRSSSLCSVEYRNLTGVSAYVPNLKRDSLINPLFACDVSVIDPLYLPCRKVTLDGQTLDPSTLSLSR